MKQGKDIRDASGRPEDPNAFKEVMAVSFVLVEQAPGAFGLRLVVNDEVLSAIRSQGGLESFLQNVDELYAQFRSLFQNPDKPSRPH
ncbi:MAG TPA: hypothetical protein VFP59_20285 [Candidatus Angelobacter sp.]|jgi:hypothetical protein|nr:hypothetical protein [Candidatus Angelobacter sp.]